MNRPLSRMVLTANPRDVISKYFSPYRASLSSSISMPSPGLVGSSMVLYPEQVILDAQEVEDPQVGIKPEAGAGSLEATAAKRPDLARQATAPRGGERG